MTRRRKIAFWDCDDGAETLYHTDRDEAIQAYLESLTLGDWNDIGPRLTVYGYARMDAADCIRSREPLRALLEDICQDYGGPDCECDRPGEKMLNAEKRFLAVVAREYVPWGCEVAKTETVDIAAWIEKNAPELLEDKS